MVDLLNFKKDENSDLRLNFKGKKNFKKELIFDEISLKEKNNIISIKNLILSGDNKIDDVGDININYIDKENLKNDLQITKKDKDYLISGNSFNINNIIDRSLDSENDKKSEFFNRNLKLIFNVEKIYLW